MTLEPPQEAFQLPAGTQVGSIHLHVSGLEPALDFYQGLLGFQLFSQAGKVALLSASGHPPAQIILVPNPKILPKEPNTTGLYHVAIRLPDRPSLGRLLQRIADHPWPLHGGSDHLVSEALYMADQDGNGIELYVDKPRETWPYDDGTLTMGSAPLNYRSLIREAAAIPAPWEGIHPGTDIGHIHLQVSDLARSENFYHHVLGLDITQRNYPGALFLSAGGYHHHLGLNIWNSRGASPSSSGHAGLISFELKIPGKAAREALLNRLEVAQVRMEAPLGFEDSSRTIVYDPDSIRISV